MNYLNSFKTFLVEQCRFETHSRHVYKKIEFYKIKVLWIHKKSTYIQFIADARLHFKSLLTNSFQ